MLTFGNTETVSLVHQSNNLHGMELYSYARVFFCSHPEDIAHDYDNVWENKVWSTFTVELGKSVSSFEL